MKVIELMRAGVVATGLALVGGCAAGVEPEGEPAGEPREEGVGASAEEAEASPRPFDMEHMGAADRAIEEAIAQGRAPGAVLLVGLGDEIVYRKAYGERAVEPEAEAMTVETVFDHASLTKPIATATAVMILADRGEIDLDEAVATYIPSFGVNGKESITVGQLLLHHGGLAPANAMADYAEGGEAALAKIYAAGPRWPPGSRFAYSDLGYIVLGALVEQVDGRPLDEFAREEIFEPLGMGDTRYNPPEAWVERVAPTERRGGAWIRGEVHDPRAYALGGVAGHAGLFGTADDLARYSRMILNGGELEGRRILSEQAVAAMIEPHILHDEREDARRNVRSYGFDVDTGYSSPRGERFGAGEGFGHTGFTGTSVWIVPEHEAYIILLTNRVHPDGSGRVVGLRREVATIAAEAIVDAAELEGAVGPQAGERRSDR